MEIDLKRARLLNGYTQDQMAKSLGVHVQTYRKMECNPDLVEVGMVKKISRVLGISYDIIFFGDNSTFSRYNERDGKEVS